MDGDEWVGRWMDVCTGEGWSSKWVDGWIGEWVVGVTDVWVDGYMDG